MDILFFSLFRTDNAYSSISLSMARELAKTHRVFYVNHPYSWKDVAKSWRSDPALRRRLPNILFGRRCYETLDSIPGNFLAATPALTLPINWLPKGLIYNFLQKINNRIVLRCIRRMLRDQGVQRFLYLNCYDPFFAGVLPKNIGAELCIYHCIDDITQNAYTARHGADLEKEAIRQADLTLVTSSNLLSLKQPYSDRVVTYFNAADNSVFERVVLEKFPRPAELAGCSGPVIGFIGNLDELRIDYELLFDIAQAHPDKTLLLVGPLNSPEPATLGLDRLPNVVFAGPRPLQDLPPLLQHMDVALIPFRCNTLTRSIYPLKINEYLAAGKPVVSTSFSDDIRGFGDCIYLAEDRTAFVHLIDQALTEHDQGLIERRLKRARSNSWAARIRQLWDIIEQTKGRHERTEN